MPSYALTSDTSVDHERKCYVVKMALTPCEPARLVWRPTALPELRK